MKNCIGCGNQFDPEIGINSICDECREKLPDELECHNCKDKADGGDQYVLPKSEIAIFYECEDERMYECYECLSFSIDEKSREKYL